MNNYVYKKKVIYSIYISVEFLYMFYDYDGDRF